MVIRQAAEAKVKALKRTITKERKETTIIIAKISLKPTRPPSPIIVHQHAQKKGLVPIENARRAQGSN